MSVRVLFSFGTVALGIFSVLLFDGSVRTIATLAVTLWFFLAGLRVFPGKRHIPLLTVPLLIPMVLSFSSASSHLWEKSLMHVDALVLILMMGASIVVAVRLSHVHHPFLFHHSDASKDLEHATWLVAGVYGCVVIWLSAHALFPESTDAGTLIAVLVYLFLASFAHMVGRLTRARWQHGIALALLGLALSLLCTIELGRFTPLGVPLLFFTIALVIVGLIWLEYDTFIRRPWWKR